MDTDYDFIVRTPAHDVLSTSVDDSRMNKLWQGIYCKPFLSNSRNQSNPFYFILFYFIFVKLLEILESQNSSCSPVSNLQLQYVTFGRYR